jgi:hypothetical protein
MVVLANMLKLRWQIVQRKNCMLVKIENKELRVKNYWSFVPDKFLRDTLIKEVRGSCSDITFCLNSIIVLLTVEVLNGFQSD